MSEKEFRSWMEFYTMSPFDDLHRFHRPAALIARSMSGSDIGDLLEWLQPRTQNAEEWSAADINTFKALGMGKPPRRQ